MNPDLLNRLKEDTARLVEREEKRLDKQVEALRRVLVAHGAEAQVRSALLDSTSFWMSKHLRSILGNQAAEKEP